MANIKLSTGEPSDPVRDAALLIARILLGWIFVRNGYDKVMDVGSFSGYLGRLGVPLNQLVGPVGVAVEFLGGIALIVGFQTRYASLLMAAFVIVATLLAHRYWEFADMAVQRAQHATFYRHAAIIGGFLALFAAGGGRYSIDGYWRR